MTNHDIHCPECNSKKIEYETLLLDNNLEKLRCDCEECGNYFEFDRECVRFATSPWYHPKEKDPPRDGTWILGEWPAKYYALLVGFFVEEPSPITAFYQDGGWQLSIGSVCLSVDPIRYAVVNQGTCWTRYDRETNRQCK